jgi:long-chain-fatty-acid--CoA ligase ACSBG
MHKLQINERSAVAIMGFNSPEWAIGFIGSLFYNSVVTGIYTTNAPDACHY